MCVCVCVCAAVESDDHGEDPSLAVDTETELSTKKRQPSSERAEENQEEKSEDKKENSLSFSNTNFDPVAKRDDLPKGDKPVIKGVFLASWSVFWSSCWEIFSHLQQNLLNMPRLEIAVSYILER